jgi:DNA replication initiation complex subunit (GINS family)
MAEKKKKMGFWEEEWDMPNWSQMANEEKQFLSILSQEVDDELKLVLETLDKLRFIKNTCFLALRHIRESEQRGALISKGAYIDLKECISDLEKEAEEVEKMEKQEYKLSVAMRKIIEKGNRAIESNSNWK